MLLLKLQKVGKYGTGFAVMANRVCNFAEKTQKSLGNIENEY